MRTQPTYLLVSGHNGVSTMVAQHLAKQGSPDIVIVTPEEMILMDVKTVKDKQFPYELMKATIDYKRPQIFTEPKNYINGRTLPRRKR